MPQGAVAQRPQVHGPAPSPGRRNQPSSSRLPPEPGPSFSRWRWSGWAPPAPAAARRPRRSNPAGPGASFDARTASTCGADAKLRLDALQRRPVVAFGDRLAVQVEHERVVGRHVHGQPRLFLDAKALAEIARPGRERMRVASRGMPDPVRQARPPAGTPRRLAQRPAPAGSGRRPPGLPAGHGHRPRECSFLRSIGMRFSVAVHTTYGDRSTARSGPIDCVPSSRPGASMSLVASSRPSPQSR